MFFLFYGLMYVFLLRLNFSCFVQWTLVVDDVMCLWGFVSSVLISLTHSASSADSISKFLCCWSLYMTFSRLIALDASLPLIYSQLKMSHILRPCSFKLCMCLAHFNTIHWVYITKIMFLPFQCDTCSKAVLQQSALQRTSCCFSHAHSAQLISNCKAISHRVPDVYSLSSLGLWLPYAPLCICTAFTILNY